jgi:hypothetical protein
MSCISLPSFSLRVLTEFQKKREASAAGEEAITTRVYSLHTFSEPFRRPIAASGAKLSMAMSMQTARVTIIRVMEG